MLNQPEPHKSAPTSDAADPDLGGAFFTFLVERASTPAKNLGEPAPDDSQLAEILRAAVSAPDHGAVRPWRFLAIRGEGRARLGDLFAKALAARDPGATDETLETARSKALRAPLVLAVVAALTPGHPKVPVIEQKLSCAMATQNLLLALEALGYGGVLVTGANAYDTTVKAGLGLGPQEELIGFLHIGTPQAARARKPRPDPTPFLRNWP